MAKRKKNEKANFEEPRLKRIREAPTRDEKISLIKEFQPKWYASVSHLKPGTIATYGGRIDSRIQKENPGLVRVVLVRRSGSIARVFDDAVPVVVVGG